MHGMQVVFRVPLIDVFIWVRAVEALFDVGVSIAVAVTRSIGRVLGIEFVGLLVLIGHAVIIKITVGYGAGSGAGSVINQNF